MQHSKILEETTIQPAIIPLPAIIYCPLPQPKQFWANLPKYEVVIKAQTIYS